LSTFKNVYWFNTLLILVLILSACSKIKSSNVQNSTIGLPTKTVDKSHSSPSSAVEKSQKIRFITMADSRGDNNGISETAIRGIMSQIKKISPQPQFIFLPGDLINSPKSSKDAENYYKYFKKTITDYYNIDIFYPGLGNHEVSNGINGEIAFKSVFNEFKATFLNGYNNTVYCFSKGNSKFFMLNSDHFGQVGVIDDTQLDWLRKNIDPNYIHNLYFFHEPAFPTGPHLSSSLDINPNQRNKLWSVIDQSNGPMVFCGHEHLYTRRHINSVFNTTTNGIEYKYTKNIFQITAGSFGVSLNGEYKDKQNVDVAPIAQYHFLVVDIDGDKISGTAINIDGKVIDKFEQTSQP